MGLRPHSDLLSRIRTYSGATPGYNEAFQYDNLDRLTGTDAAPNSVTYDAGGNIQTKDGKTYTYGTCGAGPHAVCSTGGAANQYDASGNLTSGGDRAISYTPSNRVASIYSHPATSVGHDTGEVEFVYNAEGNRVVQSVRPAPGGTELARTIYTVAAQTTGGVAPCPALNAEVSASRCARLRRDC